MCFLSYLGVSFLLGRGQFGEVAMSFFIAGVALGDVGVVALCKTHLQSVKSHLGERAGAR